MNNRKILALLSLGEAFTSLAALEIRRDSGEIKSAEINDSKSILTGQLGHSLFRKIHFSREYKTLKEIILKLSCLSNEALLKEGRGAFHTLESLKEAEKSLESKYISTEA